MREFEIVILKIFLKNYPVTMTTALNTYFMFGKYNGYDSIPAGRGFQHACIS
jgi:hypothetical protein